MKLQNLFPDCFDTSFLRLDSEQHKGMISIDEKNYIVLKNDDSLIIHGSGLKGKHMPKILDTFIDDLVKSIFKGESYEAVLQRYKEISRFPRSFFTITTSLGKNPKKYKKTTLYAKLVNKLKAKNIEVPWGHSLRYVKTVDNYLPTVLWKDEEIDYKYYKVRISDVASRVLNVDKKKIRIIYQGFARISKWK